MSTESRGKHQSGVVQAAVLLAWDRLEDAVRRDNLDDGLESGLVQANEAFGSDITETAEELMIPFPDFLNVLLSACKVACRLDLL